MSFAFRFWYSYMNSKQDNNHLLNAYCKRMSLIDSEITNLLTKMNSQAPSSPTSKKQDKIDIKNEKETTAKKLKFNRMNGPSIQETDDCPISSYVYKLQFLGDLEPELLIYSAVLIDRYLQSLTFLFQVDIKALIACSLYLANKMILETQVWDAEGFSELSEIGRKALSELEIEFLKQVDFRIFVNKELFFEYVDELQL